MGPYASVDRAYDLKRLLFSARLILENYINSALFPSFMKFANKLGFGVEWNYRTLSLFIFLLILPNLLGMINLPTLWGFKIHAFQLAIFIAAIVYGPTGGLLSGLLGSFYSAFIMATAYIVGGNAILGFFVGLFVRHRMHTILAVLLAFIIQLPWLIVTDYYLMGLSASFIQALVIALVISNLVWATVAHYSAKPIKAALAR